MTAAFTAPVTGFELARTDATVRTPRALAMASPEWLPAVVPGGAHESLLAAGRIPHPYAEDGENQVRWVEDATWWYRARFPTPDPGPGGIPPYGTPPGPRPVPPPPGPAPTASNAPPGPSPTAPGPGPTPPGLPPGGLPPDRGPGTRVTLVCHGLDTVAAVFLNGAPLGTHVSQFRPAMFDVTGLLAPENELLIRFDPPLAGLHDLAAASEPAESLRLMRAEFAAGLPAMLPPGTDPATIRPPGVMSVDPAITLRRKATFSWGWDFAPRLPSVGVSGPVELRTAYGAELTAVRVRTLRAEPDGPDTGRAEAEIIVAADAFAHPGDLTARVTLTGPDGVPVTRTLTLTDGTASTTVHLDRAYLWWTHDLGTPHRYAVRTELFAADGTLLDATEDTTGLRTIALDRSPDPEEGGRLFRFVLNGVPLFARGANWVPPDMLTGSIPADAYRPLVDRAVAANMNMLRVWGGGVYPPDAFFTACDAAGVLVWQDFMFACVDYPDDATGEDAGLPAEITAEAEYQVRRLRGHPCLALWCGNNEVQDVHAALRGGLDGDGWGRSYFHDLLPGVVARLDPDTPYWPGSPWGEDDPAGVNGVRDGDRHAWEVWHGQDKGAGGPASYPTRGAAVHFARYAYDRGKFISEFGIHASPESGTLLRWAGEAVLRTDGPEFARRIKDAPASKGDDLLEEETGRPAGGLQYADFSMATQAEGLKFGIEHYRRRRPHCSGALLWQFNDAWPGMSWSVLDYDGVAKAGYYFAQRAFRPVLASFTWSAAGLTLWLTNDLRTGVAVRLRVRVATFAGSTVLEEEVTAAAPPGGSAPVWTAPPDRVAAGPDRYAWVAPVDRGDAADANRLFFAPVKRLRLGPSRLAWRILRSAPGHAELELTSRGYTYLARVAAPAPGVRFSANYLDLPDGATARIRVSGLPGGFDPAGLAVTGYAGTRGQESAAAG